MIEGCPIDLTPAARARLRRSLEAAPSVEHGLRLAIRGGGCAGFQYDFLLDTAEEDDLRGEEDGIRIFVDPVSAPYLAGATLDFEESLVQSRFVLKNPNARTSCGCGLSFTA